MQAMQTHAMADLGLGQEGGEKMLDDHGEAEKIWRFGKSLGLASSDADPEVVEKIVETQAKRLKGTTRLSGQDDGLFAWRSFQFPTFSEEPWCVVGVPRYQLSFVLREMGGMGFMERLVRHATSTMLGVGSSILGVSPRLGLLCGSWEDVHGERLFLPGEGVIEGQMRIPSGVLMCPAAFLMVSYLKIKGVFTAMQPYDMECFLEPS
ncbi:hypothetical protein Dimus_008739 [Dionaea muscipula]